MRDDESERALSADGFEKVCHDLKQSIATGLMLCEVAETSRSSEFADKAILLHQQFELAAELVARLEEPVEHPTGAADLASVVRDCVSGVADQHEVSLTIDPGEHQVAVEPLLLRRSVGNLLDNACRASGVDGAVAVNVASDSGRCSVEVADDGPGFGQIASHTGHGLEVVRAAVWAGDGDLQIDTGPGRGTVVRMIFPATLALLR